MKQMKHMICLLTEKELDDLKADKHVMKCFGNCEGGCNGADVLVVHADGLDNSGMERRYVSIVEAGDNLINFPITKDAIEVVRKGEMSVVRRYKLTENGKWQFEVYLASEKGFEEYQKKAVM